MFLLQIKCTESVAATIASASAGYWMSRKQDPQNGDLLEIGFPTRNPNEVHDCIKFLPQLGVAECKLAGWGRFYPPEEAAKIFLECAGRPVTPWSGLAEVLWSHRHYLIPPGIGRGPRVNKGR